MGYIKNTEKYTLQFPISFGDYVIGSDGNTGATKNFTISSLAQLIIDNIDTPITALISVESITLDGNEITVINAVYAINGFVYTVEEQVLAISYAQEGYYRSDLLIGNTDGVLVLLPGEESTIVSLPPSLPIDSVGIATINVFGNTIEIVPSSEAPTLQEVLESGSIGVVDKNISIVSADFDNNEVLGIEAIYSAGLNIYKQTEDGSAGLELRFDEQGVKVIDSIDNVGLVGSEDFSSNATSLSYIQKGYVDAQIADVISEWVVGTYNENKFVYKYINNQQYVFRSTIDNNTTKPLLNSQKEAWGLYAPGGTPLSGSYVGVWSSLTAYVSGNIVDQEGFLYYCITGNTNQSPKTLTAPYWFKIGQNFGAFDSGYTYANGDVIILDDNTVRLSNYDNNDYDVDYGVVSNWELVNGMSNTVVCWGDSLTYGSGSTGTDNYPGVFSLITGWNTDNQGVPGETSTQIKTRFLAAPDKHKYATIIYAGRNNYSDLATVLDDIADMVSALGHDRYLIIGIIKAHGEGVGPIEALNTALEAEYKNRFVDLQKFLLSVYDTGQPQDVIDHADGELAWSILSDWLHLNNKGYYHFAKLVASKKEFLIGGGITNLTDLQATSIQITGNERPLLEGEGGELFYADGKMHIAAYDRINNVTKDVSIGFNTGSKVYLGENVGRIFMASTGGLPTYTSGNAKNLLSLTTGEIVYAETIGTGKIPYQDVSGIYSGSSMYYNGNEIAIDTTSPESGFKFQSPSFAIGVQGQARFYGGTLDATTAYLQVRDLSVAQKFRIFTTSLIVSSGVPADTGERLQIDGQGKFAGTVKGADAILPNEFVTLGQSNRSIIDDSITSMPTAASLDSAYPSVPLPYYVIAKNISSGASPTIFIKHSPGVWLFQPLAVLT